MEKSDGDLKVVVLTAGTNKREECSYTLNKGSADECAWGLCDGHAESVCYRLASFYLITEMHRYNKNRETSILEIQYGGFALKEGIKFHFFTTQPPCGFMAKEERHFLSWKIPFKGKPHCLQCSSTILIGAYLGIQGPLSHLFSKPVYISSITIPKYKNVTADKGSYIKIRFEQFQASFDENLKNTDHSTYCGYKFHIPHVEIANVELCELFPKCFMPNIDESDSSGRCPQVGKMEKQNKKETKKSVGGTLPDPEGSYGSHLIVSTLKSGIGTNEFRKTIASQLKYAAEKEFSTGLAKVMQKEKLKWLKEAQLRLCKAMNIKEALKQLKGVIIKKMEERFTTCQSGNKVVVQLKEMKRCRSITDKLTAQVNELCTTMHQFKNDQTLETLPSELLIASTKIFNDDSESIINDLYSVNESIKEIQNDTNSVVDVLADYYDYQQALDNLNTLLEEGDANNHASQFYLDLMGCDWVRYMKSIQEDIDNFPNCTFLHTHEIV